MERPDLQHLLVSALPRRLLLAQSSEPRLIACCGPEQSQELLLLPAEPEPSCRLRPLVAPPRGGVGRAHARQTSSLILWPARLSGEPRGSGRGKPLPLTCQRERNQRSAFPRPHSTFPASRPHPFAGKPARHRLRSSTAHRSCRSW